MSVSTKKHMTEKRRAQHGSGGHKKKGGNQTHVEKRVKPIKASKPIKKK